MSEERPPRDLRDMNPASHCIKISESWNCPIRIKCSSEQCNKM